MGKIVGFEIDAMVDRLANQAVIPAIDETSLAMGLVAERVARVDTGEMARGWDVTLAKRDGMRVRGGIKNDVPHTIYQEYGTRTISPNNMTGQAIDAEAPGLPGRIRSRI